MGNEGGGVGLQSCLDIHSRRYGIEGSLRMSSGCAGLDFTRRPVNRRWSAETLRGFRRTGP